MIVPTEMAMAMARIGPYTFVDSNNNGERDADERQAGVEQLVTLVHDPDRTVRETAATTRFDGHDGEQLRELHIQRIQNGENAFASCGCTSALKIHTNLFTSGPAII